MIRKNLLRATAALALVSLGCLSDKTTGGDISGDVLQIHGVAATGWAMTKAKITIVDAEDELIFEGATNELGRYLAKVDRAVIDFPLSITVSNAEHALEALVALPDSANLQELRAHINPITNLVARELRARRSNLSEITEEELDSVAKNRLEDLLGEGVRYEAFARCPEFVAAVRERPEIVPSTEDMILHSLYELAERREQELEDFLDEQKDLIARLLVADAEFHSKLVANLELFGLEASKVREELEDLIDEEIDGREELLELHLDSLRVQYRELKVPSSCLDQTTEKVFEEHAQKVLTLRQKLEDDSTNEQLGAELQQFTQNFQQLRQEIVLNCAVSVPQVPELDSIPELDEVDSDTI